MSANDRVPGNARPREYYALYAHSCRTILPESRDDPYDGCAEYELLEAFAGGDSGNAERVAGAYLNTRTNQSTFEKIFTLVPGPRVTANEDGSITTAGIPVQEDLAGGEQRWVEIAPLVFEVEGSDEQMAFREDGGGRITYVTGEFNAPNPRLRETLPVRVAPAPPRSAGRQPGGVRAHGGRVARRGADLPNVREALPEALRGAGRRTERRKAGAGHGRRRLARPLAWATCALALLVAVGMVLVISDPVANLWFGASPLLSAVLMAPFAIAALTAGVLVYAAIAWGRGYWGLFGRLHYSLVALSALTLLALLGYYNLIGFQF